MTSLNANVGLPSDLDFTMKKGAPRGIRCFRTQLAPIGGISTSGATNGDTLKWDIPTGRKGQYINPLETYVQIKVKNGGTGGEFTIDGSAYCFFNRLQFISSGAIIEDIAEYANFCNTQIDAGVGSLSRQTAANILMGCATDSANVNNVIRSGNTIASGTSQTFALPLISGILGAQGSTKYFPVGAVTSDLRCEITLQQTQAAAVISSATIPSLWSITEANLMLSYIEVDSDVQSMIDAANGGNYYISSETWRNYGNNISAGSLGDTVLVPCRFSSVKGLIHTFRPTAGLNSYLSASQTHRVNPFYHASTNCSVQYSIGSMYYPQTPIRTAPELFVELQRYYHNLANPNITGAISSTNYFVTANPAVLTNFVATVSAASTAAQIAAYFASVGSFAFGINLDQISNRSDVIASGISTLSTNVIANMQYATPFASDIRLDSFAHLDVVLCVESGLLTVRM